MNELPKITFKQQKFVMRYAVNGNNASEAYRFAYDCEGMSKKAINVEASKLLKNPKVALWINYYRNNSGDVINKEFRYTVKDAQIELEEAQELALKSLDKYGNPNINAVVKIIENKCKLGGLMNDKVELAGGVNVQMGTIEINEKVFELKIGESVNGNKDAGDS